MALFLRRPSTPLANEIRRESVSPEYIIRGFRRGSSPGAHSNHDSGSGAVYLANHASDAAPGPGDFDLERQSPDSSNLKRLTWAHSEDSTVDEGAEEKTFVDRLSDIYENYGLRHITPIILLAIYSAIGAGIFLAIEYDSDEKHAAAVRASILKLQALAARNISSLWQNHLSADEDAENKTFRILQDYTLKIAQTAKVQNALHPEPQWTFASALLYVGTLYTTIGYGNIYAKTTGGQVATIFYCLLGIPLMLAILGDLGGLLADCLTRLWNMLMDRINRAVPEKVKTIPLNLAAEPMRKLSSLLPSETAKLKQDAERAASIVEAEAASEADKDEVVMPASAALSFTCLWLVFCSILMLTVETKWSFFDAFYFFFISLTTIGLGDVVPEDPKYLIANFWAIIVGLIIVAMCISVIQERIEYFFYKIMMMIENEYAKLLEKEANGEITDRQKRKLMKRFLNRQPFMTKHVLPKFLGKHKSDDFHHIIQATTQKDPVELPQKLFQSAQKPNFYIPVGMKEKACQTKAPKARPSSQVTFSETANQWTPQQSADSNMLIRTNSVDAPASLSPTSNTEYDNNVSLFENDLRVQSVPSICVECEFEDASEPDLPAPSLFSYTTETNYSTHCQTEEPLLIDQQVMVDSRLLEHTDVLTQVDTRELGDLNEKTEESQTDIASILCELTIVPRRERNHDETSLLDLAIDPANLLHDVKHDTQTQTFVETKRSKSAQTHALALYDVYHQTGPALCDFREKGVSTFYLQFSQEAQTDRSGQDDDLADTFFDSSSDSYSLNAESPSLPIILEEDEGGDDEMDVSWDDRFSEPPESPDGNKLDPLGAMGGEASTSMDSGTMSEGANALTTKEPEDAVIELDDKQCQTYVVELTNRQVQTASLIHAKKTASSSGITRLFSRKHETSITNVDQATTMDVEFLTIGTVDKEIQTIDSYLKLAKGLSRLSRNRAASLKIMAAPGIRNNKLAAKMKKLEEKASKS